MVDSKRRRYSGPLSEDVHWVAVGESPYYSKESEGPVTFAVFGEGETVYGYLWFAENDGAAGIVVKVSSGAPAFNAAVAWNQELAAAKAAGLLPSEAVKRLFSSAARVDGHGAVLVGRGLTTVESFEVLAAPTWADRVRGCLLGGAVGDALGYPVEFDSLAVIRRDFGRHGVRWFTPTDEGKGLVSDDTQMTLFTVDGILAALQDAGKPVREHLVDAYLNWFITQGKPRSARPGVGRSALLQEPWLFAARAPGATIMRALDSAVRVLDVSGAVNDSKGCGAVMRSAPFGLVGSWSVEEAYANAVAGAAITHGHPTGQVAAGAFAVIIHRLMGGNGLVEAVEFCLEFLRGAGDAAGETLRAVERAVALAGEGQPSAEVLETLGGGWIAEEALAIAVYCALSYPEPRQVSFALSLSVSHSGDSDSTGAVCGNIIGALHGEAAIPSQQATMVEGSSTIKSLADALSRV